VAPLAALGKSEHNATVGGPWHCCIA
jgi:hypothetical protein